MTPTRRATADPWVYEPFTKLEGLIGRRAHLEAQLSAVTAAIGVLATRAAALDADPDARRLPVVDLGGQCREGCRCREGIDFHAELLALFPDVLRTADYGILETLPPTASVPSIEGKSNGGARNLRATSPATSSSLGVAAGESAAAMEPGETPGPPFRGRRFDTAAAALSPASSGVAA